MTHREREERDLQIINYKKTHTYPETGKKFSLDARTIFRICKKEKKGG